MGDLHRYDLLARSWVDLSNDRVLGALPTARMGLGLAASGQALYAFGGINKTGGSGWGWAVQLLCASWLLDVWITAESAVTLI